MTYVMGQVPVTAGGAVVPLFTVPSGLCNVTFWNSATSGTVYVGSGTGVTSTNGLQCHSIPTSFFSYTGSGGQTFYGTAATANGQINYIICTDQR